MAASHDEDIEAPSNDHVDEDVISPAEDVQENPADSRKATEPSKSSRVTWNPASSNKRKLGPGLQEQVKSKLLELAETEHAQKMKLIALQEQHENVEHEKKMIEHAKKMQIFNLKEEIATLKKEKLRRELGLQVTSSVPSVPRVMVNYSAPSAQNATLSTSAMTPTSVATSVPPISHIWQPFGSNE